MRLEPGAVVRVTEHLLQNNWLHMVSTVLACGGDILTNLHQKCMRKACIEWQIKHIIAGQKGREILRNILHLVLVTLPGARRLNPVVVRHGSLLLCHLIDLVPEIELTAEYCLLVR